MEKHEEPSDLCPLPWVTKAASDGFARVGSAEMTVWSPAFRGDCLEGLQGLGCTPELVGHVLKESAWTLHVDTGLSLQEKAGQIRGFSVDVGLW